MYFEESKYFVFLYISSFHKGLDYVVLFFITFKRGPTIKLTVLKCKDYKRSLCSLTSKQLRFVPLRHEKLHCALLKLFQTIPDPIIYQLLHRARIMLSGFIWTLTRNLRSIAHSINPNIYILLPFKAWLQGGFVVSDSIWTCVKLINCVLSAQLSIFLYSVPCIKLCL